MGPESTTTDLVPELLCLQEMQVRLCAFIFYIITNRCIRIVKEVEKIQWRDALANEPVNLMALSESLEVSGDDNERPHRQH